MTNIPDARPASTVVLLRDTHNGMETLMLKRNKALMFAGGLWVFPGGALEPTDIDEADGNMDTAARIAAAREAEEECGLRPDLTKMVHLSRWATHGGSGLRGPCHVRLRVGRSYKSKSIHLLLARALGFAVP